MLLQSREAQGTRHHRLLHLRRQVEGQIRQGARTSDERCGHRDGSRGRQHTEVDGCRCRIGGDDHVGNEIVPGRAERCHVDGEADGVTAQEDRWRLGRGQGCVERRRGGESGAGRPVGHPGEAGGVDGDGVEAAVGVDLHRCGLLPSRVGPLDQRPEVRARRGGDREHGGRSDLGVGHRAVVGVPDAPGGDGEGGQSERRGQQDGGARPGRPPGHLAQRQIAGQTAGHSGEALGAARREAAGDGQQPGSNHGDGEAQKTGDEQAEDPLAGGGHLSGDRQLEQARRPRRPGGRRR